MFGIDAGESGDAQTLAEVVSLDNRPKALPGARVVTSAKCRYRGALELLVAGRTRHLLDRGEGLITRHCREKAQRFAADSDVGIVACRANNEVHRLRIRPSAQKVDRRAPQTRRTVITPGEETRQNRGSRLRIGPCQRVQSFRTYGEIFAVAGAAGLRGSRVDEF